ncbi:MAG: hypothetical protein ACFFG0_22070 [Candidatus Thorarchaeota archaeon]
MNIFFQIISYAFFIIVGIIFIKWYIPKKGWDKSIKKMLIFVISWKTVMLFLLIGTAFLKDFIWSVDIYIYSINIIINTVAMETTLFIINCLLGILFFEIIFKQVMQEVIIIIIVFVETIIGYGILYPIFYLLKI